jgi:hypothetical protein
MTYYERNWVSYIAAQPFLLKQKSYIKSVRHTSSVFPSHRTTIFAFTEKQLEIKDTNWPRLSKAIPGLGESSTVKEVKHSQITNFH